MTAEEYRLHTLKKEAEIRHKMGKLVPSWMYEEMHRLEKRIKQRKQNESNVN